MYSDIEQYPLTDSGYISEFIHIYIQVRKMYDVIGALYIFLFNNIIVKLFKLYFGNILSQENWKTSVLSTERVCRFCACVLQHACLSTDTFFVVEMVRNITN